MLSYQEQSNPISWADKEQFLARFKGKKKELAAKIGDALVDYCDKIYPLGLVDTLVLGVDGNCDIAYVFNIMRKNVNEAIYDSPQYEVYYEACAQLEDRAAPYFTLATSSCKSTKKVQLFKTCAQKGIQIEVMKLEPQQVT